MLCQRIRDTAGRCPELIRTPLLDFSVPCFQKLIALSLFTGKQILENILEVFSCRFFFYMT